MSIPATILAELTNLQAQTVANAPVKNASRANIIAMQLNAEQLLKDVYAAQFTLAGALDTWTAFVPPTLSSPPGTSLPPGTDLRGTVDPVEIINGILGLLQNAQDEQAIVLMRGLVGRVAGNLDQLP